MIKIIVADSQFLVREGLKAILQAEEGMTVVGEAANSYELHALLEEQVADLVTLDYSSYFFSYKDIKKVLAKGQQIKVLGITFEQHRNNILKALQYGIHSHVLKSCSRDEIVDAVVESHKGEKFFCGEILDRILQKESDLNNIHLNIHTTNCGAVKISNREIDIIRFISEGMTNEEIAHKLFISTHTVKTHRKNIMKKLGINNVAKLVVYAFKECLIDIRV